ncbi:hypothetical protein [Desulfurispira natronophila]|uniref:Uncharacterized protein n=1 Tax=Desulfurispira natronophila TaxID=682562 RepID=A0A7W7Y5M7_9BACT|nr:hypothetical protein [Desulfurispira natronophila]MBB5022359.1 hypothetical protein [Desulfurispira natronophila]
MGHHWWLLCLLAMPLLLASCGVKTDIILAEEEDKDILIEAVNSGERGILVTCKFPPFFRGETGILRAEKDLESGTFAPPQVIMRHDRPNIVHMDSDLDYGTTHYRYTCAGNQDGRHSSSPTITVNYRPLPEPPQMEVKYRAGAVQITLKSEEEGRFEIVRSSLDRPFESLAITDQNEYTDSRLTAGRTYRYKAFLRIDAHTISGPSEEHTIQVP